MAQREVKSEGPCNAAICLVGDAPRDEEDQTRKPFVGATGSVLTRLLREAGIDRSQCYTTYLCKHYLGVDEKGRPDFAPYYKDKTQSYPTQAWAQLQIDLRAELTSVNPKVVVALGEQALRALTPYRNLNNYRGSPIPLKLGGSGGQANNIKVVVNGKYNTYVVPTYPPYDVCREWPWYPLVLFDLQKAKRFADGVPQSLRQPSAVTPHPPCEVEEALTYIFLGGEPFSYDIETAQNQITMIGFAPFQYPTQALVVPFIHHGDSLFDEYAEIRIWEAIKKLLEGPALKIAHNAPYDNTWLSFYGINVNNLWMDTMLAWHTLHPELPRGLDTVASVLTDYPYWKHEGDAPDLATQIHYNGMDCISTAEIATKLHNLLQEAGLWKYYCDNIHSLIDPVKRIQAYGVSFDEDVRQALRHDYTQKYDDAVAKVKAVASWPINVGSPAQISKLLYDELGLPSIYSRKGKARSTDDKTLHAIAKRVPKSAEIINTILDARSYAKALGIKKEDGEEKSGNELTVRIDPDGRVRCSYNLAGTEIGRLSASKTAWRTGKNHQNVTRGELRRMYRATPGKVMLSVDYSQAELWVVAHLSGDTTLINYLTSGIDVHLKTAAGLYGKPESSIVSDERELGKKGNYEFCYGISARGFARQHNLEEKESERFRNSYFAMYVDIGAWHREFASRLRMNPVLATPYGFKRRFWGRSDDHNTIKSHLGFICEAVVADHCNISWKTLVIQAFDWLPVILLIHDGFLLECDPARVNEATALIREVCLRPITMRDFRGKERTYTIPLEIKSGLNWGDLQKCSM